jgi:predicted Na+-dependent transporter
MHSLLFTHFLRNEFGAFTPLVGVFIELCIPLGMTSELLLGVFIELCIPIGMTSKLFHLY